MTETESYALYTPTIRRAHHTTIYRDTPLTVHARQTVVRPIHSNLFALARQDERTSDGILIALAAVTLPTAVYSFAQLWSLLAGGSLEQAIRAFLP